MISYEWNSTLWVLPPPVLEPQSTMQLGELVDSKQMMKQLTDRKARRQDYLAPLATIFLRKEGEVYEESFLYSNSERLTLMKTLPLDIAYDVNWFYDKLSVYIDKNIPGFSSINRQKWEVHEETLCFLGMAGICGGGGKGT